MPRSTSFWIHTDHPDHRAPLAADARVDGFAFAPDTGQSLAAVPGVRAVAPLMLVGVVQLAPGLPLDSAFPYLHPTRQFMHLGFSIHDAALASSDSIRGVPRAYACASLLIAVVVALNLAAIMLRNRLRERYRALET